MVKVECAGCNAPYEVEERRIPPTGMRMRCPKCGQGISLTRPAADVAHTETIELPTAPRALQKAPPPPPMTRRGQPGPPPKAPPPRATAPGKALVHPDDGAADLPAIRTNLSVRDGVVDLPSPSDLPAVVTAERPADLPAVRRVADSRLGRPNSGNPPSAPLTFLRHPSEPHDPSASALDGAADTPFGEIDLPGLADAPTERDQTSIRREVPSLPRSLSTARSMRCFQVSWSFQS